VHTASPPRHSGTFDLPIKFGFISENTPEYLDMEIQALLACMEVTPIVEVTTGAIARGLRTIPYPAQFLLHEIRLHKARVTLRSDAHRTEHTGFSFDRAKELLREAGFRSIAVLRSGSFDDCPL